jgi:futalosine hydrolase
MNRMNRILIVTAVDAECAAVQRGLELVGAEARESVTVIAGGFGAASAAASTARALAQAPGGYRAAVSAGIAGAFPGAAGLGDLLVADRIIAAWLGVEDPRAPGGFASADELGFGADAFPALRVEPLERLGAHVGAVLTVHTGTGTAEGAERLLKRYPGAVGEAMEGFGVATAAAQQGVAAAEVRAVSNLVGPRDRSAWRIGEALSALAAAVPALLEGLGVV